MIVALSHKVGNRIRFVRARGLNFLAVLVVERGNEKICFCLFCAVFQEHSVYRPVLFGREIADFLLSVHNHFECGGLHASRRKTGFELS